MAVATPPSPIVEIDDGVIKEARRRQRRREAWIATILVAAAIAAGSLALSSGGGASLIRGVGFRLGPPKLMYVHGFPYLGGQPFPLSVQPYLDAGWAGLAVQTWNVGFGGERYPQRGTPLFGGDTGRPGPAGVVRAPGGQLDWALTRPDVAAVRVSGVGTFEPVAFPGLPPHTRLVVFFPRNDASAIVTPLDHAGHPIPMSAPTPSFPAPTTYFQGGATIPMDGSCAVQSIDTAARIEWGLVSTRVDAVPQAVGPAFFSCLTAWYTLPGAAFEVALLLNAQHPGAPPAPLWGAAPVPGHSELVEMRPVRYWETEPPSLPASMIARNLMRRRHFSAARASQVAERVAAAMRRPYWITLASRLLARRVGNAWIVVEQGDFTQEIAFLNTLRITRIPATDPHASR